MNSEQLRKINGLVGKANGLKDFLELAGNEVKITRYSRATSCRAQVSVSIDVDYKVIEQSVAGYYNGLLGELKELGYEDE